MTQLHLPPVYRSQEVYDQRAQSLPWHITDVKLQDHWDHTGGGKGILVGVADTGIDPEHPAIAGRIDHAENFAGGRQRHDLDYYDGNDHGTHVATTIAGMAPDCRFAIAKVLRDNGAGSNTGVANGIKRLADLGCHIINLSLGGPYDDPQTRAAVNYAKDKGCIVVIATGNENANAVGFPAQHGLGIGAVDRGRKLAWFSNRGKHVDLVGFGVDILAGVPGGRYQAMSGTSMATPWISGVLANRLSAELKHLGSIYTNTDQRLLELETFVCDLGPGGRDTSYGLGMPDLLKGFYQRLKPTTEPDPEPEPQPPKAEPIQVILQGQTSGKTYSPVVARPIESE